MIQDEHDKFVKIRTIIDADVILYCVAKKDSTNNGKKLSALYIYSKIVYFAVTLQKK